MSVAVISSQAQLKWSSKRLVYHSIYEVNIEVTINFFKLYSFTPSHDIKILPSSHIFAIVALWPASDSLNELVFCAPVGAPNVEDGLHLLSFIYNFLSWKVKCKA